MAFPDVAQARDGLGDRLCSLCRRTYWIFNQQFPTPLLDKLSTSHSQLNCSVRETKTGVMATDTGTENAANACSRRLHHDNEEAFGHDQQIPDALPEESELIPGRQRIWWRPLVLLFLMTFAGDIGYFVNIAPQTRLFEDLACRRYYAKSKLALLLQDHGGRPDEKFCKIPAVQDVVAELFGLQTLFDGMVGILVGVYYGAWADKIGRRPILVLATFGSLLATTWILFVCKYPGLACCTLRESMSYTCADIPL